MSTKTIDVIHRNADVLKVKLERGQKGGYGWEITVQGAAYGEIRTKLVETDADLRKTFLKDEKEGCHAY